MSEIPASSCRSGSPVAMLNALWFRPGGMELYGQYGEAVLPMLAEVGAELSTPFLQVEESLEGDFDPDLVGFVRYPSATAFDDMWRSERYRRIAHLRTDAVHRAVLTRCAIEPSDSAEALLDSGVVVLNILWLRDGSLERHDEYLTAAAPLVEAAGGRYVVPRFLPDLAYDDDFVPDLVFLGNYPSKEAVFDLVTNPAYAEVAEIRTDAVRRRHSAAPQFAKYIASASVTGSGASNWRKCHARGTVPLSGTRCCRRSTSWGTSIHRRARRAISAARQRRAMR